MELRDIILTIVVFVEILIIIYLTLKHFNVIKCKQMDSYKTNGKTCANVGEDVYTPNLCTTSPCPCCDGSKPSNVNGKQICPGKTKGIIVVRHAQDTDNWTAGKTVTLPNGTPVTYQHVRLSQQGLNAAQNYIRVLPQAVSAAGFAPISTVYVKDPDERHGPTTSNPFNTIFPFINAKQIKDVHVLGDYNKIDYDLSKTQGSILICWDEDSLWSHKSNECNGRTHLPDKDKIIGILDTKYQVSDDTIRDKVPIKGKSIYAYNSDKKIQFFTMQNGENAGQGTLGYGYLDRCY